MPGHCLTFMMFHEQLSQETCRVLVQEDFPDHEDLIVPALNDELYLRRGLEQMQRVEAFCLILLSVQRPKTQEEE